MIGGGRVEPPGEKIQKACGETKGLGGDHLAFRVHEGATAYMELIGLGKTPGAGAEGLHSIKDGWEGEAVTHY
jgi:hypothetical protein